MSDELKQAVEKKVAERQTPEGKDEQIRKLMFGGETKKAEQSEDEQLRESIPDWQDEDIAAIEKPMVLQYASEMGLTNDDVSKLPAKGVVELYQGLLKQQRQESLDRKFEAARLQAKARGTDNPDSILAIYAQSAGIK